MADPRAAGVQARPDHRSALQRAKAKAAQGEVVNFCPFGCDTPHLDEHGYCPHLVGFTANGRTYEPRVRREDGRIITDGSQPRKVKAGDQLVRITSSSRVYRAVPDPALLPTESEAGNNPSFLDPEELENQRRLAELQNPQLDGVVGKRTAYDDDNDLELATRPGGPK